MIFRPTLSSRLTLKEEVLESASSFSFVMSKFGNLWCLLENLIPGVSGEGQGRPRLVGTQLAMFNLDFHSRVVPQWDEVLR